MKIQAADSIAETNIVNLKLQGFNIHSINTTTSGAPGYNRRDFYKIVISRAHVRVHYADRTLEANGPFLFFANPHVPYSVDLLSERQTGYACLFNDNFLQAAGRSDSIRESPLFKIGATPLIAVDDAQEALFTALFEQMMQEQAGQYLFKDELIRNYIQLMVHQALKLQPLDHFAQHKSAASRIVSLFLDLLERQFPIEKPQHPLALRTANDYANRLSVHVNHLNRAVKEITGKPTTTLIAERIVNEAKALLQYTDWSVAEIAYGLGFDYPTHFNNYFKRVTGTIPKTFRI